MWIHQKWLSETDYKSVGIIWDYFYVIFGDGQFYPSPIYQRQSVSRAKKSSQAKSKQVDDRETHNNKEQKQKKAKDGRRQTILRWVEMERENVQIWYDFYWSLVCFNLNEPYEKNSSYSLLATQLASNEREKKHQKRAKRISMRNRWKISERKKEKKEKKRFGDIIKCVCIN